MSSHLKIEFMEEKPQKDFIFMIRRKRKRKRRRKVRDDEMVDCEIIICFSAYI